MAKARVKFLKPHDGNRHCTYGVMAIDKATKLEAKGIVQVRSVVPDDYVEPDPGPDVALGQEA
jgi:hypothetical protein